VVIVDARDEGNGERDDVAVVEEKSLVRGQREAPAVDEDVARVVDANRARVESGHRAEIDDLSTAEQRRMERCASSRDVPRDTATTVDGPRAAATVASLRVQIDQLLVTRFVEKGVYHRVASERGRAYDVPPGIEGVRLAGCASERPEIGDTIGDRSGLGAREQREDENRREAGRTAQVRETDGQKSHLFPCRWRSGAQNGCADG